MMNYSINLLAIVLILSTIITHDNSAIKMYEDATDFVRPITIGNNVFIGANVVILRGVEIADNCIIGAGAVVTRSFTAPGTVLAGNPAKEISTVTHLKEKYKNKRFDFSKGKSKDYILKHRDRWLQK